MNERIRELAEQAGFHFDEYNEPTQRKAEKFAELIVKEMLQTCEDHPAWTGRMIGEQIKQHFGLEESKGWVCPKCGIDRTKDVCPNGHMAAIEGKCPMTMEAQ